MTTDSSSKPLPGSNNIQERLEECYRRGLKLSSERNFEYAHTMFAECVIGHPANVSYVEGLLRNLSTKLPGAKQRRISLRRGGSRKIKQAVNHKEWSKVLRLGIDLLNFNPWDVVTLGAIAQACAQLHCNESELVYLKQALDAKPKDIEINRHCARSLERMGQFDQAIACWHRIETIRGSDREAARMIAHLSDEKLKYPGGRPSAAASSAKAQAAVTSLEEDPVAEEIDPILNPAPKIGASNSAQSPRDIKLSGSR